MIIEKNDYIIVHIINYNIGTIILLLKEIRIFIEDSIYHSGPSILRDDAIYCKNNSFVFSKVYFKTMVSPVKLNMNHSV